MDKVVSPHDETPRGRMVVEPGSGQFLLVGEKGLTPIKVDVVFPVLHGTFGEDGKVQGALDCLTVPYVGAGTLGSAITNDKDITKRLLQGAGINVVKYQALRKLTNLSFYQAMELVGSPIWVKPANLGSSLGIQRVTDKPSYEKAITAALALDDKVIIEGQLEGRELECSVLEDESGITVSQAGEIIPQGEHYFYDYDAKYNDAKGAKLVIPAKLNKKEEKKIQEVALACFHALEGRHIMRVDMFLCSDNEIVVNEVQTIPGFTKISMYPKLLALKDIDLPQLMDRLVRSALLASR